jgi:glycosyltransferase involved in cell wall biosynthesis
VGEGEGSLELITFGGPIGSDRVADVPVRSVGRLDDEGLRLHYSAADVMVVPSRQDNLPQTAVEPIACGTPVVAFKIGGLPDIVEDAHTGRLVEPFSPEALAEGIAWCIEDDGRHARLSAAARLSAERWEQTNIANQYLQLLVRVASVRVAMR